MKWIGISWYLPYGHRFDSFGFASSYLPRMIRGHSWFQTTLVFRFTDSAKFLVMP